MEAMTISELITLEDDRGHRIFERRAADGSVTWWKPGKKPTKIEVEQQFRNFPPSADDLARGRVKAFEKIAKT